MNRLIKLVSSAILLAALSSFFSGFAQTKNQKDLQKKRQAERHATHLRDSMMNVLNKSDTSLNSLLQKIEQYATTLNQINNNLADGLDTVDVSQQLPAVMRRIDKINTVSHTHKSSTLQYLFVLRDNLGHIQDKLDGWQDDLSGVNTKLVQNQSDLIKFTKDTTLKRRPADSAVRKTFFTQLNEVRALWRKTDSVNRANLLKVNLLQDKIAISYTKTLDESDQINSKIKNFARRALAGETTPIWIKDPQFANFSTALSNTIRLNGILFNSFLKNETQVHLIDILFIILIFTWILYNRNKVLKNNDNPEKIIARANYVYKKPIASALLLIALIIPYFYDHPPLVFQEVFFVISIILTFILIHKELPNAVYDFSIPLLVLTLVYGMSNLFIEINNADRMVIAFLSVASIALAFIFYNKIKNTLQAHVSSTGTVIKIFIALQVLSLLLNISGRFSLAKVVGITAVFNLWMLVIVILAVDIILQVLFLGFQIKRRPTSIISKIDYELVQGKFKSTLTIVAALLLLYFLLENLNVDDWTVGYISDLLNQSRNIAGASFTFGGFVIFIFVIWMSSLASKVISYFYEVSSLAMSDLTVLKKKNRTSSLIIRIAVFSGGFLLAVSASNFPIDKLTIIISAFGVGIGFGMQNIVNNLVSGLILAFEKPIQIGDIVEVDNHTGIMKEIGIRASKVVTGDGSEVIIPNGDLISHQVINWTLSNSNRQIELKITTAYGVDIDKVKGILKKVLSNRKDVLTDPCPVVFLNNISEDAVEFRVLFWEAEINISAQLRSHVLHEIYEALGQEGIELPSTQKDFFLHFPEGVPVNMPRDKKEGKNKKD